MKIIIFCEGRSERALRSCLSEYVQNHDSSLRRTGIDTRPLNGPVIRKKLGRLVQLALDKQDVVGVIALTDVYPNYGDANDAKDTLRRQVTNRSRAERFRAHAAQYDLEAWLLPFWDEIAKKLGVKMKRPGTKPEHVNGNKPPSHHFQELYRRAGDKYDKVIDGAKWLTADRLEKSSAECPELKAFLDSLVELAATDSA